MHLPLDSQYLIELQYKYMKTLEMLDHKLGSQYVYMSKELMNLPIVQDDEFRRRYQAMIAQQQQEAHKIQQEVHRIRHMLDKQAYYNFIQQQVMLISVESTAYTIG